MVEETNTDHHVAIAGAPIIGAPTVILSLDIEAGKEVKMRVMAEIGLGACTCKTDIREITTLYQRGYGTHRWKVMTYMILLPAIGFRPATTA